MRDYNNFKTRLLDNGVLLIGLETNGQRLNVLSSDVLSELEQLVIEVSIRQGVKASVLVSLKERNFVAGADVKEIRAVESENECREIVSSVHRLFKNMETSRKPYVAAIEGTCYGGGLELVLACHWRVASDHPSTVMGSPEVKLGIIPGFGGTQRLPKLLKLDDALKMCLTGSNVYPRKAIKIGLIDDLVRHSETGEKTIETIDRQPFVSVAVKRALECVGKKRVKKYRPATLKGVPLPSKFVFWKAEKGIRARGAHYPAPLAALKAIQSGLKKPVFEASFRHEMPELLKLITSTLSKDLVDTFLADQKVTNAKAVTGVRTISPNVDTIGVLGAGLMGSQIAGNLADKGFTVLLKDIDPKPLCGGMDRIAQAETKDMKRRIITHEEFGRRLMRVNPTINWRDFKNTSLVIEAVKEDLPLKQKLLAEFEKIASPDAIFATNTSSFMVSEIAKNASHPDRCVAMHFFNPLRAMELVEIGITDTTSPDTIARTVELAIQMGKKPLVVKDCYGLLVNRILARYLLEAIHLLVSGVPIKEVDGVAKHYGMAIDSGRAMGPLELVDYIGIETAINVIESLKRLGERIEGHPFISDMVPANKQKPPLKFHKNAKDIYATLKRKYGWSPRPMPKEMVQNCLILPMRDEALRCLAEGIIDAPWQIDFAMTYGAGFPAFRGGLMKEMVREGVKKTEAELFVLATSRSQRRFMPCKHFQNAKMLLKLA